MEQNKIIFKKDKQVNDYFALVIVLVTVLLLAFQILASKHISKANDAFFAGEKAKRIAVKEKTRKEQMEKALEEDRLLRKQEEQDYLASLEEQNTPKEKNKFAEVEKGMDYREKLNIYRRSNSKQ